MALVDVIAGARPNFIKVASLIHALRGSLSRGGHVRFRLVHTGQHYDKAMSESFFEQLGIPEPDVNLEVGSGTQAEQTGAIMVRYERLLMQSRSDLCLVVGDVTSTLACAVVSQKLGVPVAHVEGGLRSGDWRMPEEINRLVTDAVSNFFFTTSETAGANLRDSGVPDDRIFFVGNTMIDTLIANLERLRPPSFWESAGLRNQEYFILTLHRPSNVDAPASLLPLVAAVCAASRGMPVVFPVHPRTAKTLAGRGDIPGNLLVVAPQPYLEFNFLVKNAKAVVTDSGGITEETTVMGVPCMTLRNSTERPETVTIGTNVLLGTDPEAIPPTMARLFGGTWKRGGIPDRWDGQAGLRIVAELERLLADVPAGRGGAQS